MNRLATGAVIVLLAVIALNLISLNATAQGQRTDDWIRDHEVPTPTCQPDFYVGPCH